MSVHFQDVDVVGQSIKECAGQAFLALLTSAALLTACATERVIPVADIVCPTRASFTVEQADAIADAIETLPPGSPLIAYVIDAEGVHAQLDAVCP